MLSPNELSKLYEIISDENQTFESISRSFEESFKEVDKLRMALSLSILINSSKTLSSANFFKSRA